MTTMTFIRFHERSLSEEKEMRDFFTGRKTARPGGIYDGQAEGQVEPQERTEDLARRTERRDQLLWAGGGFSSSLFFFPSRLMPALISSFLSLFLSSASSTLNLKAFLPFIRTSGISEA